MPRMLTAAAQGRLDEKLFSAVERDDIEKAIILIREGANVNARNDIGDTPIFSCDSTAMALVLLAACADVNAENYVGCKPLDMIFDPDVQEMLRRLGATEGLD